MALLQIQIDIDSDVHPELHAGLLLVARMPARAERLRQLAAAGLIWEQLRAQARSSPVPAAAGPSAEIPPASAAVHPAAIAGDTRPTGGALRAAPRGELPVLMDVIDETALPVSSRAADPDGPDGPDDPGAPLPLASGWDLQGPGWSHDRQESAAPPARKLGPRPRLLKMREKGLFQNGSDG